MLRSYSTFIYLFLYAPIVLIVLFSFNSGNNAAGLTGFSVAWYGKAFTNRLMTDALQNSLVVASVSSTLAALIGTMAALSLQKVRGPLRVVFDGLTYIAIMVPGIVIGIATLIAIETANEGIREVGQVLTQWISQWLGQWLTVDPGLAISLPIIPKGYDSIIAAHTLFSMALVIVIVRARIAGMDRSLIEASMDLYADPWATFRQITLPQLAPAIVAGFLLGFTFSFDDYVVASFVNGSRNTLPIYVFSSIRRGVTPEINAIGTSVMLFSLSMLVVAQFLLRRQSKGKPAAA
ncbi:MAG TPA: ABC transporter permease [Candidatus Cybelea sp.]|nr:ABC transporter permease [Candidatus Cybelea sp.]